MDIIHITPHVGGGVGSVLNTWVHNDNYNTHGIICLEPPNRVPAYLGKCILDTQNTRQHVRNADVVVFHLWNNPPMYDLLTGVSDIHLPDKFRAVAWGHSSGTYPPYMVYSRQILSYFDKIVFTSPISYTTISKLQRSRYKNKLCSIWSTSGLCIGSELYRPGLNITYIGSMDLKKMAPWFFDACYDIIALIDNVKFHMVGDGPDLHTMRKDVISNGRKDNFMFHGYTKDIKQLLAITNVFGYPLSRFHFGTCEQVIGEAMSCGIPVVSTDNKAESYILKNGHYGLLSKDKDTYVKNVIQLIHDERLYAILAERSLERAKDLYSVDRMITLWNSLLKQVAVLPKIKKQWSDRKTIARGFDVFLESIGKYSRLFCDIDDDANYTISKVLRVTDTTPSCWSGPNKGTPEHYIKHYVNNYNLRDQKLERCVNQIKEREEKSNEKSY